MQDRGAEAQECRGLGMQIDQTPEETCSPFFPEQMNDHCSVKLLAPGILRQAIDDSK